MTAVRSGLTTRITVGTVAVALFATLLVGVVLAPLLRSTAESAVREPLARQAGLLARLPASVTDGQLTARLAESADLSIGALTAGGVATGPAEVLTDNERAAVLGGAPVSTEREYAGVVVLIEARPARAGGAVVVATDANAVDAATSALRRRTLLALVLGMAAAIGIGWLVARRLAAPLHAVAAGARRLAAGERGVHLPDPGTREVADVSNALRSLDETLRSSENRQREFLLSVSHELRTPLTAIHGYAEALAEGVVSEGEQVEVARTMLGETERMNRYVGDLLALARLQAEDFALEVADVDVAALVLAAAEAWQGRATAAGVDVHAEVSGPVVCRTDGGRLRQVVDALVDNAVRVCAAAPGTDHRVVVATRATETGATVEVRDTGPGLTDADVAVAFVPGALHQRYAGTRPGGHGLGLAIVARLVALLGGSIRVGTAPEGGAGFEIRLP